MRRNFRQNYPDCCETVTFPVFSCNNCDDVEVTLQRTRADVSEVAAPEDYASPATVKLQYCPKADRKGERTDYMEDPWNNCGNSSHRNGLYVLREEREGNG